MLILGNSEVERLTNATLRIASKVTALMEDNERLKGRVAELVEALELARYRIESERRSGEWDPLLRDIGAVLTTYRKQGGEV